LTTTSIKKLSDRDHIRQRPAMYIGAVNSTKTTEYISKDDKIQYIDVNYVPGLIKIINEIIDNSVDVAIKTNFKSSNEIKINMSKLQFSVEDNGTGIPVKKSDDGIIYLNFAGIMQELVQILMMIKTELKSE